MEGSSDNKKLKTDNDDDDDDKELQQIKYRLCRLWGRIVNTDGLYNKHIIFLCEIGPNGVSADVEMDINLVANAIQDCNTTQGLEMEQYMLGVLEHTQKN